MLWLRRKKGVSSRLVLHVGRHKTGSTSLQQSLASPALKKFGILYPQSARLGDQHAALPALGLSDELRQADIDCLLDALVEEISDACPRLAVMSSEVFCELAKRQPERCSQLLRRMSAYWSLELVQIVRPLPTYFLSALKHQLRAGIFLHRSPLSWYSHCRDKTALLDHFWTHAGYRLTTLPYDADDACSPLVALAAERTGLDDRATRRLLHALPKSRENSSGFSAAIYVSYFVYLIAARKGALHASGPPQTMVPILLIEQFAERLQEEPALLDNLEKCGVNDQALLDFCSDPRYQMESTASAAIDWQHLCCSDLYALFPLSFIDWLMSLIPSFSTG